MSAQPQDNSDGGPNDQDGYNLLPCNAWQHDQSHDATNHGFRTFSVGAGPDSGGHTCQCGTGPWKYAWTQDCLDHDYCSGQHNSSGGPADDDCGDEFDWATDDVINGKNRDCSGGDGHDCGPGQNLATTKKHKSAPSHRRTTEK